jgi:SAM-dependent methyltransferase
VTVDGRDAAAGWLSAGRFAGMTDGARARANERLARIANHVLWAGQIKAGDHVVDVGAGTGLLTHMALSLVGPDGLVTAVDQSAQALTQIEVQAGGGQLRRAVADVAAMPLESACADVAVARSVLIYLEDLPAALVEIGRVLRPGGRLSVFEPVNSGRRHDALLRGLSGAELTAIAKASGDATPAARTMTRFSEQALRLAAVAAGFGRFTVTTSQVRQVMVGRDAVDGQLTRSPHPGAPSPLETIEKALGAELAGRYAAAWRTAVDVQGTITYMTPTIYFSAVAHQQPAAGGPARAYGPVAS